MDFKKTMACIVIAVVVGVGGAAIYFRERPKMVERTLELSQDSAKQESERQETALPEPSSGLGVNAGGFSRAPAVNEGATSRKIRIVYDSDKSKIDTGICYSAELMWVEVGKKWVWKMTIFDDSIPEPPSDHPIWEYLRDLKPSAPLGGYNKQSIFWKGYPCG